MEPTRAELLFVALVCAESGRCLTPTGGRFLIGSVPKGRIPTGLIVIPARFGDSAFWFVAAFLVSSVFSLSTASRLAAGTVLTVDAFGIAQTSYNAPNGPQVVLVLLVLLLVVVVSASKGCRCGPRRGTRAHSRLLMFQECHEDEYHAAVTTTTRVFFRRSVLRSTTTRSTTNPLGRYTSRRRRRG